MTVPDSLTVVFLGDHQGPAQLALSISLGQETHHLVVLNLHLRHAKTSKSHHSQQRLLKQVLIVMKIVGKSNSEHHAI